MLMNNYKQKLEDFAHSVYFPFLALFLVAGLVCVLALRHNNTTMIGLRNDVYAADKNNGDVEGALQKLRSYVYGHMNTNLSTGNGIKPPIQLSYTYARLQAAQQQNTDLYVQAKNYCEAKIPADVSVSGRGRIDCITQYVTDHGAKPTDIPVGLYEFDFLSPRWSPDLAGWSMVVSGLSFAGFAVTFLLSRLSRARIRSYLK
jgi:hypothetical protein